MGLGRQTTLSERTVLSGIGVHSNIQARIALNPAEAYTGIVFSRTGLPNSSNQTYSSQTIEADWSRVTKTKLCTVIGKTVTGGGRDASAAAEVATVEHVMAAFSGLGLDNVLVEIDGPEVPILDGSAAAFVEAIDAVGMTRLDAPRRYLKVLKRVRIERGGSFCELEPNERGLTLDVEIDFACGAIGRQRKRIEVGPASFRRDLARARTFGFLSDVERLWKAGFALGASLENTVGLHDEMVLNPEGLRFSDEFVRHKMLDALGDLALAGAPILGTFRSYRGGHAMNVALLEAVFSDATAYAMIDIPPPRRQSAAAGVAPGLVLAI